MESLDFAEPAVDAGLLGAVTEVADDLFQTSPLLWVDAEQRTPDVGFSELSLGSRRMSCQAASMPVGAGLTTSAHLPDLQCSRPLSTVLRANALGQAVSVGDDGVASWTVAAARVAFLTSGNAARSRLLHPGRLGRYGNIEPGWRERTVASGPRRQSPTVPGQRPDRSIRSRSTAVVCPAIGSLRPRRRSSHIVR